MLIVFGKLAIKVNAVIGISVVINSNRSNLSQLNSWQKKISICHIAIDYMTITSLVSLVSNRLYLVVFYTLTTITYTHLNSPSVK